MGTMKTVEDVQRYVSTCLDKVELAYGRIVERPICGFIPYEDENFDLTNRAERYLSKHNDWRKIKISDLQDEFVDEYWSVFHYLGWQGLYRLTPLLIKLAYDAYLSGDELCMTVENLFSKFPRDSDDRSLSFLDWMSLYDQYQIVWVIDLITLLGNDPLGLYPDGFREGRRWWARYYLDGPSS